MTRPRPGAHHRGDDSRRHAIPEPASELEARYLAFLAAEGMSPETVRQRIYLLRAFDDPATVTADDIVAMLNSRDLSQHSRAAYFERLRGIYADLIRLGIIEKDPTVMLKKPRTPRRSPRPITEGQLATLETMTGREYEWTILGAYAGLRVGEVCSITGMALQDGQHGPVLRVRGKGNLDAVIPAHPKVAAVMEPYAGNPDPLWPIWPQSTNRAWQRAAESVGVTGVTFHQLRHTFATRLTRAGIDLLVIADLCRHASVATTQRYAAVAEEAPFRALGSI